MNDAIGDYDIGGQELSAVDVDVVSDVGHCDVSTLFGNEFGTVDEAGGIDYVGREHVVVEDCSKLLNGH